MINAAGVVMVAVFFTFALSGPLPPKEMGVILGVAVLLDAFVVRLLLMPVRLLAGAVGLSAFGDWVAIVALGLHVTDISDSGYVVALLWV